MSAGVPAETIRTEAHYRQALTSEEKLALCRNSLIEKLRFQGYSFEQPTENVFRVERDAAFVLCFAAEINPDLIRSLRSAFPSDEIAIIVASRLHKAQRGILAADPQMVVFDLQAKTYRKLHTRVEAVVKGNLGDRFARFVRETY